VLTTTDVNGIAGIAVQGPPPYTAALIVGAGAAHESFRTMGVAHLVEHLAMGAQPRSTLDVNAEVDDVLTVFHAAGPAAEVAAHLGRLCATLRELPTERLTVEAKVLLAEDGSSMPIPLEWSAATRFGANGTGLLGRNGPPPTALDATHVTDFVRRHYTSGNAVIVATGPLPRHPDIRLPRGGPVVPPRPTATQIDLPAYLAETPVPVISWIGGRGPAHQTLARLVVDRLTDDLRHRDGLVYDVDWANSPIDDHRTLVAVWTDGDDTAQQTVLAAGVNHLRRLADLGPSVDELTHHLAVARSRVTDPRATLDHLVISAFRHLHSLARSRPRRRKPTSWEW
jgi:hypothetical protein